MAFKILSHEEIAVLNEYEKKVYEQAYQEYLERIAFVERLEELDKVRMPKVFVKRNGIKKIRIPAFFSVKAQKFTADTTMGANLLNATKMVKRATNNNSKLSAQIIYRTSLPNVIISTPDVVKTSKITSFIITKTDSVRITEPSVTKCEMQKFGAIIPKIPKVMKPEFIETVIDDYYVSGIPIVKTGSPPVTQVNSCLNFTALLPFVKVAEPGVGSIKPAHFDIVELKQVPVTEPTAIDASIEDYKISQFMMNIIKAPTVNYVKQDAQTVKLSVVPISNCPNIPVVIKDAMIDVPTVEPIKVTNVAVNVCPTEITRLKEVYIPQLAPEVQIEASNVTVINAPIFSEPKAIHYSEPSRLVRIAPVSVISAPHIDIDSVLKTMLPQIR